MAISGNGSVLVVSGVRWGKASKDADDAFIEQAVEQISAHIVGGSVRVETGRGWQLVFNDEYSTPLSLPMNRRTFMHWLNGFGNGIGCGLMGASWTINQLRAKREAAHK